MKSMLLMRYRAIAASLYQYILTHGTMYGKMFGFANGRERPAMDGAGDSTTTLYQIANGILKWVDTALLHSTMGMTPDTKAMGKDQYTENLLMQSKTRMYSRGAGHTYWIIFGRGRSFSQTLDRGLGRVATTELGFGKTITQQLYRAALNPAGIVYGEGSLLSKIFTDSRLRLADVIGGAASTFMSGYSVSSLSDADIAHGRGLMSSKVVTNSGISTEDVIETLMKLSTIGENHYASIMTQGLENILANTVMLDLGSASGILLDMNIETRGMFLAYLRSIGHIKLSDVELSSVLSETETIITVGNAEIIEYGDADYWQEPIRLDENTLYIRSVYNVNQNDSTIYIE